MPPKQVKSKAALRAELQEKVREIQNKQQKWLQERKKSLNSGTPGNKSTAGEKPEKHKEFLTNSDSSQTSDKPKQQLNVASNSSTRVLQEPSHNIKMSAQMPTKSGFHTWISNRQHQNEKPQKDATPDYNPSNYHDSPHNSNDNHADVPHLALPSSCSATSSISYRETESSLPSDDCASSSLQNGSLSPEKFDALADKIINRVKRELHLEKREMSACDEASSKLISSDSARKQVINGRSSPNNSSSDISSHKCPVCHELMLPPVCRPQLLIPCGHTACQKCTTRSESCHLCHHQVQSSTPNIMLQQIIADYHQRALPDENRHHTQEPSVSKRLQLEQNSHQTRQLGKTYSQLPSDDVTVPQTPRKTAEEYEEEYHNLLLRCDVLRDEEQAICDKMSSLEQQKQTEHRQIENISATQKRLQQDIEKIQKQIEALEGHKEEYRSKISDLEMQKKKERRRLDLVRSTISQLRTEINKIKKELQSAS